MIRLLIFKEFVYDPTHRYLLAGDETVENKAGEATHGIGLFYSSIYKQAINSVSFLNFSLIDTTTEKSSMIACRQIIRERNLIQKKPKNKDKNVEKTKPKGRPKGSKNKVKAESENVSYQVLKSLLSLTMSHFAVYLPSLTCFHLVLDGFYGHESYLLLAIENSLNIISKLKKTANLKLQYQGEQKPRGRHKIIGKKLNLEAIDPKFFIKTIEDKEQNVDTKVYQLKAFTPKMPNKLLNIVVLIHVHKLTKKQGRSILFSNDLTLTAQEIIDYYSLRFQIEFEFRDAKQHFGLSDFKNYKETQVTNAVNVAFSMNLISQVILEKYRKLYQCQKMGILDLKTIFRTQKYAKSVLIFNNIDPDEFLLSQQFLNLARFEAIHL